MGRRQAVSFFGLMLVFSGIGGLAAHRFVPEKLLASMLIGSVFGIMLYVWLILLEWSECEGDGTCLNCPKRARLTRLQRFCGNHPRITLARRLAVVVMGACLAGAGFIFGHVIAGAIGVVVLEILTNLKLIGAKLMSVFHC